MKTSIKIFFLVLIPFISNGQINPLLKTVYKSQVDSLQLLLQNEPDDTTKMIAYRDLAVYYIDQNGDSMLYFGKHYLELTKKLGLKLWEAEALDLVGLAFYRLGNYTNSLSYFLEAIELVKSKACEKNIWRISRFTNDDNPMTARLSLQSIIHGDFGDLYLETNNLEYAEKNFSESIKIAEGINDQSILAIYSSLMGEIMINHGKEDSAMYFLERASVAAESSGYKQYEGDNLTRKGNISLQHRDFEKAKSYYFKSISTSILFNNMINVGENYLALSDLYLALYELDSSLYYAEKGLKTYQNVSFNNGILDAKYKLYKLYKTQNEIDNALYFLEQAMALNDSIKSVEKIKQFQNIGYNELIKIQELEQAKIQTQNRIRTYALLSGLGVFFIIGFILYMNNRQKQKTNQVLENTLSNLKSTQAQLIQSEKMASLGELTAGIAHEIQNPLNFVNNFSEVSKELIDEMNEDLDKGDILTAKEIGKDIEKNLEKINHHGHRASSIVKGMLDHSRSGEGVKEMTDINTLADEYLRLAYHGLRAKDKSFNADFKIDFDETITKIEIIPQDIGRVLLNLINNAFYAVSEALPDRQADSAKESAKLSPIWPKVSEDIATEDSNYKPMVTVSTKKLNDSIEMSVKDNGPGIPPEIKEKIFQPFFTTKPTGSGTGLGLSLSYDIVKAHNGDLNVISKKGDGSEFIISIPVDL